jgi:flagellin
LTQTVDGTEAPVGAITATTVTDNDTSGADASPTVATSTVTQVGVSAVAAITAVAATTATAAITAVAATTATAAITAVAEVIGTTTVNLLSIDTFANAQIAIESVDGAIADIDTIRAGLGAIQNRFEATISNLMNVSENIAAARSRILDADFAAETSDLTKAQILQQAGMAMLSQANMIPQNALSLLQ